MIYADTDFFLALLKGSDWLKSSAKKLLGKYRGQLWTSSATLIELLLLSQRYGLNAERVIVDAIKIARFPEDPQPFVLAADYVNEHGIGVFDALHAAFCGTDRIISSDKVFDKLGLTRVALEKERAL